MYIANPIGLIALLALPAIVWLHVYRPRRPVRRVAGVFLWGTRTTPSGENGRPRPWWSHSSVWLDFLAGLVLVMLAVDVRFASSSQPDDSAGTLGTVYRVVLCVAVAALLGASWFQRARRTNDQ